jgi:copper resistance protein B
MLPIGFQISGRFTGTFDVLLSQRLILQPRLEASVAVQSEEEFGIGSGLDNVEPGVRARYEIWREFAPYIGITYARSFGETADFARREGESTRRFSVVAGVRMWF